MKSDKRSDDLISMYVVPCINLGDSPSLQKSISINRVPTPSMRRALMIKDHCTSVSFFMKENKEAKDHGRVYTANEENEFGACAA